MGWNLLGGLMPPAANTAEEKGCFHSGDSGNEEEFEILEPKEIKEHRHSEDSGNESQEEADVRDSDVEPSVPITLQFQLTQSLLSQVKASENNRDANSGKQAYKDLPRVDFVINGQVIDKNFVSQLRDKYNQNDQRQIAKHVFTKMFEHAKAEIPNDNLLEELITSCNQAGYDGSLLMQLSPIFLGHDLQLPDANDRHIEIVCSDQDSLNVKYCPNMPVKQLGKEICRVDAILEFTLKFRDSKVEYENGKVTLAIPEQLENYKADGKSLLDEINRHFEDEDNRITETLEKNVDKGGPKSFVVDLPAEVDPDSFDIIPENAVFNLGHIPELIKKAVDDKDVNDLANHIGSFQDHVTHVSPKEGLPVVEKILEIVSGFIKEQGKAWNCRPTVPIASHIYSAKQYCDGYISQADYEKVENLERALYKIKSDLIKRSSNSGSPAINAQDTSATLNETPISSQAVSRKQLNNKESKNQQLQRNVVDEEENIMNNKKVSIEETIDNNNYRRGKMFKNKKTIEENLSNAIDNINYTDATNLLIQPDTNIDKSTLQKLLGQANDKMKSLQESKGKKDRQKNNLIEIITLLEKELEKTATALPAGDDVGATASSQQIPVKEVKERESDSSSLSSDNNDFSKLESDDSARSSPSFEVIDEIEAPETAELEATAAMPSMATEEKSDDLNDEKDDQQNLTIPTAVDQGTSPIPESQCGTAHNEEDFTVPPQSSSLDFANESLNTVILTSDSREEQVFNQPAGHIDQMANEDTQSRLAIAAVGVVSVVAKAKLDNINDEKDNSAASNSVNQDTSAQNPVQSSPLGFTEEHEEPMPEGQSSFDGSRNSDQRQPDDNTNVKRVDGNEEEQTSNKPAEHVEQVANENTQPKSVANKQASHSNKSYTKENSVKWPTVATWMFAVTGVIALAAAPAAYFALGTSLLVAGVAVGIGAFCIVAAIAVHYYNKTPSGPLKGPDAETAVRNVAVGAN